MTKIIDVSNNNGRVDFVAAKKAGAVGVYLKVTEGTGFVDSTYLTRRAAAKRAGLMVGGYHFGHPKNRGAQEAAFFLAHLKLEPGDLIPMLDLEVADGAVKPYAQAFLRAVKAKHGQVGLYAGSYFIQEHDLAGLNVPRWIPSYGAKPKLYSYAAWQFSDGLAKYPGAIEHLDTSYVYDMHALTFRPPAPKPVPVPAPKPSPQPEPVSRKTGRRSRFVTLYGMRMRRGSKLYRWAVRNLGKRRRSRGTSV